MHIVENKKLSYIPNINSTVDDTSNCAYKVCKPLPSKSFAMLICGQPGSGKTTTWLSLLLSHPTKKKRDVPRFYYRYFDKIYLISGSMNTLPLEKLGLDESRMFNEYSDEILDDIISNEREGENLNNLIILDDVIRDIRNSKSMAKLILNRRHCTNNKEEEDTAGLAVILTSQVYNLVPLCLRKNFSHVMIFRTENQRELTSIKSELMADLDDNTAKKMLNLAWDKPHGFLLILTEKPTKDRYYSNFDKIVIEN